MQKNEDRLVRIESGLQVLSREVFGNGTPGGMKVDIAVIKQRIEEILESLEAIKNQVTVEKEKVDPFSKLVKWTVDKVLPSIVISFVFITAQMFFFTLILMMFGLTPGEIIMPW